MRPLDALHSSPVRLEVRPAESADREALSNLIFSESHVHKHLDWKTPLDWLGDYPYVVLQEGRRITGALACPPDPDSIAWLRLFAFASHVSGPAAWRLLWGAARQQLEGIGGGTVAAIATQRWLDPILLANSFDSVDQIVLLEMNTGLTQPAPPLSGIGIRAMTPHDLPQVEEVDRAAFGALWRNSLEALESAFKLASYASVAESTSGLIGYQLSTGGPFGTHLARLAVMPSVQRRGLGAALVHDLIAHIPEGRESRLTVNTQSSNTSSLALYHRLGFRRTGERFPVLALNVTTAGTTPLRALGGP
jgi:ribosomal protein S18 acetylase RimI-like enzyme